MTQGILFSMAQLSPTCPKQKYPWKEGSGGEWKMGVKACCVVQSQEG